jgi:HD-like signal output (HDOD) protein
VAEVSSLVAKQSVPDTDRLIEIVHMDPVVVASVLRRINSAYYGMRRRFDDIRRAVLMMGFLEVCNIVLTSGMIRLQDVIKTDGQQGVFDAIMRISVGAGYYSQQVANHLRLRNAATAFTAGLLHAIGRLVLLHNAPTEYAELWVDSNGLTIPTPQAERDVFGYDNLQLGALAADTWSLPEDIVTLIGSYQSPEELQDRDLHIMALVLRVSVDASQTLLAARQELIAFDPGPFADVDITTPPDYTPSASLSRLAHLRESNEKELAAFIRGRFHDASDFIEHMLQG